MEYNLTGAYYMYFRSLCVAVPTPRGKMEGWEHLGRTDTNWKRLLRRLFRGMYKQIANAGDHQI